jgi:multiple sugar transport system substrate-binding protein
MTELHFSVIGDDTESIAEIARLAKEFQGASHTAVNVTRLTWDRAWQTLLMTALEGKGGDLSQVGSTWAPTLAAVDSLRPFSDSDVRSLGGPLVFVPAAWQTVRLEERGAVWSIPWSVYTFVIFYRRDLLQRAGVDETVAFSTPEAMIETFTGLHTAGINPWVTPTKPHYLDLPHIASSWVRAYGGDFIHPSGRQVLFNTPHARRGLLEFFALFRFLPDSLRGLDYDACLAEFFEKGSAAVMIAGAESYSDALATQSVAKDVHGQVGVVTVPGVSWIGGDHLVVWKTVRADPQKEQAAVDLIRSLTSVESQVRLHRETTILPSRLEAYIQLDFQPEEMNAVLEKVLQTARPHPPIRLWRRIESMLVDMLSDIEHHVLEFRAQTVTDIVETKLAEYEKRFSLILGS